MQTALSHTASRSDFRTKMVPIRMTRIRINRKAINNFSSRVRPDNRVDFVVKVGWFWLLPFGWEAGIEFKFMIGQMFVDVYSCKIIQ